MNEALTVQEAFISAATETKKDIIKQALSHALKLYKLDNGRYPTSEQGGAALVKKSEIDPVPRRWREGGYIEKPKNLFLVDSYSLSQDG